jgi:hypothetical protein
VLRRKRFNYVSKRKHKERFCRNTEGGWKKLLRAVRVDYFGTIFFEYFFIHFPVGSQLGT